jgi:hypothetical protein
MHRFALAALALPKRLIVVPIAVLALFAALDPVETAWASTPAQIAHIPIDNTFVAPCTGETVSITGTLQVVTHVLDDSGGGVHGTVNASLQNVRGMSGDGVRYRAVGALVGVISTSGRSEQAVSHQVDVMNLISQGSAPNLVFVAVFHITFDGTGAITADFTQLNIACRGA